MFDKLKVMEHLNLLWSQKKTERQIELDLEEARLKLGAKSLRLVNNQLAQDIGESRDANTKE